MRPARPRVLVPSFVGVAVLLVAGCVEPAGPGSSAPSFVTAQEHRQEAQAVAHTWDARAYLHGVMGIESPRPGPGSGTLVVDYLSADADPNVGDGKASRWLFSYRRSQEGSDEYFVVLDGNARTVLSRAAGHDEHFVAPFGWTQEWAVDSDGAANRARTFSPTWAVDVAPTDVTYMLWSLPVGDSEEPGLWWSLSVSYPQPRQDDNILVNGATGEARWAAE